MATVLQPQGKCYNLYGSINNFVAVTRSLVPGQGPDYTNPLLTCHFLRVVMFLVNLSRKFFWTSTILKNYDLLISAVGFMCKFN